MIDFLIDAIGRVLEVFIEDRVDKKIINFIGILVIIGFIIFVIYNF